MSDSFEFEITDELIAPIYVQIRSGSKNRVNLFELIGKQSMSILEEPEIHKIRRFARLRAKELRSLKRKKILCECGSTVRKDNFHKHKLTRKHREFIEFY